MKRIVGNFGLLCSVASVWMVLVAGLGGVGPAHAESARTDRPYRMTTHFKFYGDKEVQPLLDKIAAVAESHYTQLCGSLGACDNKVGPIDVWIASNAETFAAGFRGVSPTTECAAGIAFLDEHRVILRAQPGALMTVTEAFDHELAHVLAHSHEKADARPLPRWFREGVATRLSGDGLVKRLEAALRAAPKTQLTYEELAGQFPERGPLVEIAHAQAALLVKRAVDDGGVDTVVDILKQTGRGVAFEAAFDKRLSMSPVELFGLLEEDLKGKKSLPSATPWAAATIVSVAVGWWRLSKRKKQMAQLDNGDDAKSPEEDMAAGDDPDLPPELAEPKR